MQVFFHAQRRNRRVEGAKFTLQWNISIAFEEYLRKSDAQGICKGTYS